MQKTVLVLRALTWMGGVFLAMTLHGDTWYDRSSPDQTNTLFAVATGPGGYVAAGARGTILTSRKGVLWTSQNSGISSKLLDVGASSNLWVAVGKRGVILTSSNRTNWWVQESGTTNALRAVTLLGPCLVAVGDSGTILTSPDGVTWRREQSGTLANLLCVTFAKGVFVIGDAGGGILSSRDGRQWSETGRAEYWLSAVVYGNGLFVAIGPGEGGLAMSNDGMEWFTYPYFDEIEAFHGVVFGAGYFIAASWDDAAVGLTWNGFEWDDAGSFVDAPRDVTWANGVVTVVGERGTIMQWDGLPPLTNQPPTIVEHPRSRVVPRGSRTTVPALVVGTEPLHCQWERSGVAVPGATSSSLVLSNAQLNDSGEYRLVITNAWGASTTLVATILVLTPPEIISQSTGAVAQVRESVALAVTLANTAQTRFQWFLDGQPITGATNFDLAFPHASLSHAGIYTLIASNVAGAVTSAPIRLLVEGEPLDYWHERHPLAPSGQFVTNLPPLTTVCYGNGRFMAVGIEGAVLTSPDGVIWADHSLDTNYLFNGAAAGAGRFVVTGARNQPGGGSVPVLLVSENAVDWTPIDLGLPDPVSRITCDGIEFFAFGGGKKLVTSYFGSTWNVWNTLPVSPAGMVYANRRWVVVGGASVWSAIDPGEPYWQYHAQFLDHDTYDLAFGNGLLVALLSDSHVSTSRDRVNWGEHSMGYGVGDYEDEDPSRLVYGHGYFVAVGGHRLVTSLNGTNWVERELKTSTGLNGAAFGTNSVVVVSSDGSLFQSDPLSPTAPWLARSPENLTVTVGHTATLAVLAYGTSPLRYQWFCDEVPLSNETQSTLTLTAARTEDSGHYRVVVSNALGLLASDAALLTVLPASNAPARVSLSLAPVPKLLVIGCTGCRYRVEYADALDKSANWQVHDTVLITNTPTPVLVPLVGNVRQRFYRAVCEPD